jgi:hypothetical protein
VRNDNSMLVLNLPTGKTLARVEVQTSPRGVTYSPVQRSTKHVTDQDSPGTGRGSEPEDRDDALEVRRVRLRSCDPARGAVG